MNKNKLFKKLKSILVKYKQSQEEFTAIDWYKRLLHSSPDKRKRMKKITYKIEHGLVYFMIDGTKVATFRASVDLERDAHVRAFILGIRYRREDEFDPIIDEIN